MYCSCKSIINSTSTDWGVQQGPQRLSCLHHSKSMDVVTARKQTLPEFPEVAQQQINEDLTM